MALEVIEEPEGQDNNNKVEITPDQISELVEARLKEALKDIKKSTEKQQQSSSIEDLASMISKGVSDGMKSNTGQFEFNIGYEESQIDPDDYLEPKDQVVFAVHRLYDVIVADKRNGRVIKVPLEPIEFKIQATKIVKNGKESNITNVATYTCCSKKELKWLKEHTQYGIRFFDRIDKAISVDAHKASILAKNMTMLGAMNQYNIIKYSKEYGVPFSEDLNVMRAELANQMTNKELGQASSWQNNMFKEQMEEAVSVGKDNPLS